MGYEPITYCRHCNEPNDVYMAFGQQFCSEECESAAAREHAQTMKHHITKGNFFNDLDMQIMDNPISLEHNLLNRAGWRRKCALTHMRIGNPRMARFNINEAHEYLIESRSMRARREG